MVADHLTEWGGFPVVAWERDMPISAGKAYRLSLDYEEGENGAHWTDLFDSFLQDPAIQQVESLIVGMWEDARYTTRLKLWKL